MSTLIVGCGFIGRPAAVRLVGQGERVLATSRRRDKAEEYAKDGIELVVGDLLSDAGWDQIPAVDRVFYAVGYDRSQGVPMRTVYVDGLERFLKQIKHPVKRFVYASSTSVYGLESGEWVDEQTPPDPRNDSGAIVLEAEAMLQAWATRTGANLVILRYAGLYGPRRIIGEANLRAGDALSVDPDGWLNLVHRDDAAEVAVQALMQAAPASIYTVCDDRPVTRCEYYECVAAELGAPGPKFVGGIVDKGRRRVSNARMMRDLLPKLVYPSIFEGMPASLAEQRSKEA